MDHLVRRVVCDVESVEQFDCNVDRVAHRKWLAHALFDGVESVAVESFHHEKWAWLSLGRDASIFHADDVGMIHARKCTSFVDDATSKLLGELRVHQLDDDFDLQKIIVGENDDSLTPFAKHTNEPVLCTRY